MRHARRIRALKQLSKARLLKEDQDAFLELLISESDRAVIIMFVSALEDALAERLVEMMPSISGEEKSAEKARKSIFEFDGPLGSFGRKILFSYALGIIDEVTKGELEILRNVRNQAAHAQVQVTFETPEIDDALFGLLSEDIEPLWRLPRKRKTIFSGLCGSLFWKILGKEGFDTNRFIEEITFSRVR